MASTSEILEEVAKTFSERGKTYGNAYERVGKVLECMFPNGVSIKSSDDMARMHIFGWIIGKLVRYSTDFNKPHQDSIHDACAYCAMLESIDSNLKGNSND